MPPTAHTLDQESTVPTMSAQANGTAAPNAPGTTKERRRSRRNTDATRGSRLPKPPASWPLIVLALPAFVAIWGGWVGLGELCGFGPITVLPGISDFQINTAIALPIGMEAYAAYALRVWLSSATISKKARDFARMSAITALIVGAFGQIMYHLMAAAGVVKAPWFVTVIVACIPVAVLGMGASLAHLISHEANQVAVDQAAKEAVTPKAAEVATSAPRPALRAEAPAPIGQTAAPEQAPPAAAPSPTPAFTPAPARASRETAPAQTGTTLQGPAIDFVPTRIGTIAAPAPAPAYAPAPEASKPASAGPVVSPSPERTEKPRPTRSSEEIERVLKDAFAQDPSITNAAAAELLGVSERTARRRIGELGLRNPPEKVAEPATDETTDGTPVQDAPAAKEDEVPAEAEERRPAMV